MVLTLQKPWIVDSRDLRQNELLAYSFDTFVVKILKHETMLLIHAEIVPSVINVDVDGTRVA